MNLASQLRILKTALRQINVNACERDTRGIGQCFKSGYSASAYYADDKACDSCIADRALRRVGARKTFTEGDKNYNRRQRKD